MRSFWKSSGIITFLFLLSAGISPSVYAVTYKDPSISSDEMLEFTLNDIKNRLREVVEENSRLSARNNALRKRMLSLRQDMRELENHKLNLLERNNDVKDYMKMDADEVSLNQKKITEMESQDSFSDDVSTTLAKTLDEAKQRDQKLQLAINKVQSQIDELRHQNPGKKPGSGLEESKNSIVRSIREAGASNRALERKLPEFQKKMAGIKERHQELLAKNAAIKSQLAAQQSVLDQLLAKGKNISDEGRKKNESGDQALASLKSQVDVLKSQYEEMSATLRDTSGIRQKIDNEIASQRVETKKYMDLLIQERQQLEERKNNLSRKLDLLEVASGKQPENLQEKIAALSKELSPLQTENTELRNKITEAGAQQQKLQQQEMALKDETTQIDRDIKKAKNKSQQSVEDVLRDRKAHLRKLLASYQSKADSIKRKIAANRTQSQQAKEKINTWATRKSNLQLALEGTQDELKKAQEQEPVIRQAGKDLESRQGEGAQRLKEDLATLELRKSVLMTSLEAIKNKYSQDKDTIKEFQQGDQRELEEYLNSLKTENVALKDKVSSLAQTVKQLETQ
jgi:chromosome segregation ATPase